MSVIEVCTVNLAEDMLHCVKKEHSVTNALCVILCTVDSSDGQHLSYNGCLEIRGEIIKTVL